MIPYEPKKAQSAYHRAPDVEGLGRAWRIQIPAAMKREDEPTVENYLLDGNAGTPWHQWILYVVHLRPSKDPRVPAPNLQRPDATHEVGIVSLNPDHDVPAVFARLEREAAQWAENGESTFLSPQDHAVQVHGLTDEQAAHLGELAVRAFINGVSPDQDHRRWWRAAIENAAKHLRGEAAPGEHIPQGDHGVSP